MAAPSIIEAVLNSIGILIMKKYSDASCIMDLSAPIHIGIYGLHINEIPPVIIPHTTASISACMEIFLILFSSFAPNAFATIARIAMEIAWGILLTSHVIVVVTLTDAVAASPRCPTMAVSTY